MFPLPDIRKKIIYLDQFFLSHAFRDQERLFIDAANRIKDMAARQLVVCPYSSVHTDETHLWRHEQQENLYKFIKQTARGYKFREAYEIKLEQMHRLFDAFRSKSEIIQPIEERDAFRDEIHGWDDYIWIDLRPYLGDLEAIRQGKAAAIEGLVNLFPDWAKLTTSFEEDVSMEAIGYGRSLLNQYLQMVANVGTGNLMSYMDAPMDTMYVESLLHCDRTTMKIDERLRRIGAFFHRIILQAFQISRFRVEFLRFYERWSRTEHTLTPSMHAGNWLDYSMILSAFLFSVLTAMQFL